MIQETTSPERSVLLRRLSRSLGVDVGELVAEATTVAVRTATKAATEAATTAAVTASNANVVKAIADLTRRLDAQAGAAAPPTPSAAATPDPTAEAPAAEAPAKESRAAKARRRGFVYHGEFKYRIAYDPDVIPDRVIGTIAEGHYERFEARRSSRLVEDGDRIIELGAGLGFLSTLLLDRKAVADYIAVEADPRLPALIARTHELNNVTGPLTVRNCVATCDPALLEAGTVDFFVGEKFCASSLLGVNSQLKEVVQVPVASLTELIATHQSNVLICDIEGAEEGIFNGTPLPGITKILVETHPHRIGLTGMRRMFRHLDDLGYAYLGEFSSGHVCAFGLDTGAAPGDATDAQAE